MFNQLTNQDLQNIKLNVQILLGDRGYSAIFYFDYNQKPKIPDANIMMQPEIWDCSNWVWFFGIYPELNPNRNDSLIGKTKLFLGNLFF